MIREIDKRNFSAHADFEERKNRLFTLASESAFNIEWGGISGMKDINSWTGNPHLFKTAKPVSFEGSFVKKAMSYMQAQTKSFGLELSETVDFSPDPYVAVTSGGQHVVNMQQVYKGVPVFLVNTSVIFNEHGEIKEAVGNSVTFNEEFSIEPKVTVTQAAVVAAECIRTNVTYEQEDGWGEISPAISREEQEFEPKKLVEFQHITCRPTVLDRSIFADYVRAHLVVFYLGPQAVLGWYFTIEVDDEGLQCDVVVAAGDSDNIEVLYFKRTSSTVMARGNVHKRNGGEPREWVEFPVDRKFYPMPINGSPVPFKEWVYADETTGRNVVASLGNAVRSLKGLSDGSQLIFNPTEKEDQYILNIFYFCNFMHDFFYLLGFNEQSGSFDGDDPVHARAHNSAVRGTANMTTPIDGSSPVMNMGLHGSGNHTAVDADVVFHEYVHGVTNRLVGGRINDRALQEEQSRALGEGWSDYFALSIQNFDRQEEKVVMADWLKNNPSGIRSMPYDDHFVRTYGQLAALVSEHARGEVWCAALLHWTRHLSLAIGKDPAYFICWQSVVDGLKLTNANPSFLDARDGIFRALAALQKTGAYSGKHLDAAILQFRRSLAKFGMGARANSVGPWLNGISENFDEA